MAARVGPISFGRRRSRSALRAGRARVRPRESGLRIFGALGLGPAGSFPAAFSQRGSRALPTRRESGRAVRIDALRRGPVARGP